MPIDPDVALGAELATKTFSWTSSDVLLYHLGIGAGSRPGDNLDPKALRYTNDDDNLQVLPSFSIVAPTFHDDEPPKLDLPGCELNLAQVVHGAQEFVVHRPIPTSGTATVSDRISEIWDKGKAVVLWQEGVAVAESGEKLWTTRSSMFIKGEGGWGGDRNPLHSDPAFAQAAGFPAPILHGRCSYGIVLRTVTDELLGGEAAAVGGMAARFSGVVYPGETIRVRAWDEGAEILVSATIASSREERDGAPVLADCVVTRA